MKTIYLLAVLVLAASVLGCVGQKPSEVAPAPATPAGTSVSTTETPASAAATPSGDDFGAQSDMNTIDSAVNDSSMDIALSDATI